MTDTLSIKAGSQSWLVNDFPNNCPLCHRAIDARQIGGVIRKEEAMGSVLIDGMFQCPQRDCLRAFIGMYAGEYSRETGRHFLRLQSVTPYLPEAPPHSEEVHTISPQFVEIYKQAATAEKWDLKEIAGCGYRKSLEFLIKDYCIALEPDRADQIKVKFLASVIKDHVLDASMRACAERATWLGNDETHYVRQWTEMDVVDLKKLIALTESWITTAERTKAYLGAMTEGR